MHAVSHSLAHRAPPATRTRVRWQPYTALPSAISSRSPSTSYLHTPASSVSSSPPTSVSSSLSLCESDRLRSSLPPSLPHIPRDNQIRDAQKNKYAMGLVDQAVKSLCEIWHPQDIPGVFMTSSRATVTVGPPSNISMGHKPLFQRRNTQLPSPISPLTQPSPNSPQSLSPSPITGARQSDHSVISAQSSKSNLVPIKGFVHEVLRRSRTSGVVLQTALCYLEAIRSKVPELAQQEQTGMITSEPEGGSRITVGEVDLSIGNPDEMSTTEVLANISGAIDDDFVYTIRIDNLTQDSAPSACSQMSMSQDSTRRSKTPSPRLPPLPPLPSPLLCPRRAFLASLILASKFTQDKCYSNRAWAKLSGLPPREIGRCERALGDALEWRLWVGKVPSATAPMVSNPSTGRTVVRSRSESDLLAGLRMSSSWRAEPPAFASCANERVSTPIQANGLQRGLRRCATLPPSGFSAGQPSMLGPFGHSITLPPQMAFQGLQAASWENISLVDMSAASSPTGYPSTTILHSQYADNPHQSPMATPTLTYSPSSTESSSGDRTIQMSSFTDELMPTCNGPCFSYDNSKALGATAPSTYMTPYAPLDFNPTSGAYVSSTWSAPYASQSSALDLYSY